MPIRFCNYVEIDNFYNNGIKIVLLPSIKKYLDAYIYTVYINKKHLKILYQNSYICSRPVIDLIQKDLIDSLFLI